MATPNYKGQGQPIASSGGWLGSLLGTGAPAYAGVGQPTSKSSGYLSGSPAYKAAPIVAPKPATPTTAAASAASAAPSTTTSAPTGFEPYEDSPTAFAIVIPRQVIEQE